MVSKDFGYNEIFYIFTIYDSFKEIYIHKLQLKNK